jgi:hypothetical protein
MNILKKKFLKYFLFSSFFEIIKNENIINIKLNSGRRGPEIINIGKKIINKLFIFSKVKFI